MRDHEQASDDATGRHDGTARRPATPSIDASGETQSNLDERTVLRLQATAGNVAVAHLLSSSPGDRAEVSSRDCHQERTGMATVQRMDPQDEESTISSRVHRRNEASRTMSPRLRERLHGDDGAPGPVRHGPTDLHSRSVYERPQRGVWDGRRRSAYYDTTWSTMLATLTQTSPGMYECPPCGLAVPKYNRSKPEVNGITLDHKTNFRDWIHSTAAPNEDGTISSKAAQDAYNDTTNLEAICRDCNSSKNGPKGTYD